VAHAQTLAPFLAFPRVTISSLSTLTNASAAVTVQRTALLAHLLKSNSAEHTRESGATFSAFFFNKSIEDTVMNDIMENERLDQVNDSLSLIQKKDGLTFGTDALLLAAYISGKFDTGIEIGGGSGIISMLLLTREKVKKITAIEVQEDYASLIKRNAELNGLDTRLTSLHADAREYKPDSEVSIVFTNPPYMKADGGKRNDTDAKNAARHEMNGDIGELIGAAARMLKYGGTFAAVYRPDRITDIIFAMRDKKIEPKRMTFVHADTASESSMVLIEGKRGGGCGLQLTRPLIIYKDKSHTEYTDDMNYIMQFGSFPKEYKR